MHEISLVRTIFRTLEEEFSQEELSRLDSIDLKVGLLSNVEPLLMQTAFTAVTETNEAYEGVGLNIEQVPIEIRCPSCGQTSLIQQYKFVCAHCDTPSNNVIRGTELLIHRVHFHDPPSYKQEADTVFDHPSKGTII